MREALRRALPGVFAGVVAGAALLSQGSGAAFASRAGKAPGTPEERTDEYRKEVSAYREDRRNRLEADDGWLTVSGLFWLVPGANSFGSGDSNAIRLPAHSAPDQAGTFFLEGDSVRVEVAPGTAATLGGSRIQSASLRSDADGGPDVLTLGALRLFPIRRNDRLAIRLRDLKSPLRNGFRGIDYYPIDPAWRVTATFAPSDPPREIEITTMLGNVVRMSSPGVATFTIDGKDYRLTPVLEEADSKQLFFIMRDRTTEVETYGGGRFLYTDLPSGGTVVLDFNRAENPPCAFNPWTTCPLPPAENDLALAVRAGEKKYAGEPHREIPKK